MNHANAAIPINVGYSTYKSKRASSATIVPTEQSLDEYDRQSPPGPTKLLDMSNLNKIANGVTNALLDFGVPSTRSASTPPMAKPAQPQSSQTSPRQSPSTRAASPAVVSKQEDDRSRTSPSLLPQLPSLVLTESEQVKGLAPNTDQDGPALTSREATSEVGRPSAAVIVDAGNSNIASSAGRGSPVQLPAVESSAASSSSQTKPQPPSRQSTFRHVPLRSSKPSVSSPLRPSSTTRTVSGLSTSSSLRIPASATSPHLQSLSQSPARTTLQPPTTSRTPSQLSVTPSSSNPSSSASVASNYVTPLASPGLPSSVSDHGMLSRTTLPDANSIVPPPILTTGPPTFATSQSLPPSNPVTPSTPSTLLASTSRPSRPLSAASAASPSTTPTTATLPQRPTVAPYRPGFQPKGAYASRTDEFVAARNARIDGQRAEEKRLLRRLEKLVDLHFSLESSLKEKVAPARRSSSFFDLSDLKGKGAADLWKGVVESAGNKNEKYLRDQEQAITHWEDDKSASACPICSQSFHPLTNRKHHCRLCGRVVCALPPKQPTRPRTCSLLIVADTRTGKIQEIPETVAYGVARRDSVSSTTSGSSKASSTTSKESYSRGVRICRECNAVVQRQQFALESTYIPPFARLYRTMLRLEQQIEGSLSHFQELIMAAESLDSKAQHAATVARKELLEIFAEYDTSSKRIRALPCEIGGSQDRLQAAIAMRANLFLQQHMLPLKSLAAFSQKQKHRQTSSRSSSTTTSSNNDPTTPNGTNTTIARYQNGIASVQLIDSDSALALSLQPLLEQEALLESYVEEAMQSRKFEDAKTIQTNLKEIRAEIDKLARGGNVLS